MMKIVFKSSDSNVARSCSESENYPSLRIADILLQEEEEEEEEEGDSAVDCLMEDCEERSSERYWWMDCLIPRRIMALSLSRLRKVRGKKIEVQNDGKEQESKGEDDVPKIRCLTNGLNDGDVVALVSESNESGWQRRDTTFNLGVGCCLLYLIAASKNELHKIVELRTQMEMLLENAKEELQKKVLLTKPPAPVDIYAYSTTYAPEGSEYNNNLSSKVLSTPFTLPESSTSMVSDQSLKCHTPKQEEQLEGMNQLEAELEAELEHLQHHLDTEKYLEHPEQQRIKVPLKDNVSMMSHGSSSGEAIECIVDSQEACSEVHCGIPPYELERRLHELLEGRQQEQIRELESALECAKCKLNEKEMEISWWKDTARLLSQHIPESSQLTSKCSSETHLLFR